jgi:diguanylate cyclase (GGDEF)-like protein
MRLLGVLALVAPAMVGILLVTDPDLTASWVEHGSRSIVAAITAVTIGVAMTAGLSWLIFRLRFGRLVKAAEEIAAGDYSVAVSTRGGGLEARLGIAVNDISTALADTYDRATIDRLTGVANRQAVLAALFAEVERATRYERPLCVAFVDIDHFKAVNDSYGHAAGDVVLRGVSQTIAESLRASDLIGRYGGEEFMLILTETNVEEGAELSEKLRKLVERARFKVDGNRDLSVTISIGIVGGSGQQLRMENLVRDADAAMYSAKSLGRNQTYIFEEPDEDARVPRAPISDAGRERAIEIGRRAREAATDMLTSFIAPLPHYRGQPSALIAAIVVAMARQLQLPDAEVDRIRVAALLHDVGKVAVPEEILDKPSPLSSAEWRTVVQHPRIGQVILEHAAALKDAVPIILHHHERFAGHGYPYGLRANEIPLGARIVAIADAYDAMTHDRPYKRAMSHVAAIAELKQHAGTQFDPELVALFCDLYTSHAPTPDPTILAITNTATQDAGRRERRTRTATASSATLAAEGRGLVELNRTDAPATRGRRGDGPGTPPDHRGIATG